MQAPMEVIRYACLLVLAVLADLSLQAAIKGSDEYVDGIFKPKSPISVEHELQALVDTGLLDSSEQSTIEHSQLPMHAGSHGIEPADLARAASLVDAQLKAQGQAQVSRDVFPLEPAAPMMAVNKAGDLLPPVSEKVVDPLASMDLTPLAVAEYLFITGDFGGFEQAIRDLLMADIITVAEASQYKEAVGWEYETFLYKLVNDKAASLEEFVESNRLSSKSNFINQGRSYPVVSKPGKAAAMLAPHKVAAPGVNIHDKLRKLQMRALVEKEETLDELLNVINENAVEGNAADRDFYGNPVYKKSSSSLAVPAGIAVTKKAVKQMGEKKGSPQTAKN